jgi:hypothetical protein
MMALPPVLPEPAWREAKRLGRDHGCASARVTTRCIPERSAAGVDIRMDLEELVVACAGEEVARTAQGRAHPALCGVGGGQHPCHLWSTTGLARELVGASCQSGSGGQECCAGHESIHVVDAARLSHGARRVARVDLLGGRRVPRSEAVRGADRGAMLQAGRRALSRAEVR